MVEVMKARSHTCTPALSAANPAACHCRPTPLPETPGHSWASLGQSLLWSLFVSPGSWCAQGFVCALQECVSPVLCTFWWLYGGLMTTSSKRAYAIPRSAAPRAPTPVAGHCRPIPPQEILKQFWLSLCGVFESWCTQGLFEPSKCLWRV